MQLAIPGFCVELRSNNPPRADKIVTRDERASGAET